MNILYENLEDMLGLFDSDYQYIFDALLDYGVYNSLGFSFIGITLAIFIVFYYFYKNPYATFFPHWTITLLIATISSAVATFFIARTGLAEFLLDSDPNVSEFANDLVIAYTLINLVLALIFGFVISYLLRLGSKVQPHLPF